jgi:hypothetical protein
MTRERLPFPSLGQLGQPVPVPWDTWRNPAQCFWDSWDRWDTGTDGTPGQMGQRQRLPNRRGHELLDFEHAGIKYTAGIGRFEDGRMAEIFLHATKQGTAIDVNARDAAVAASLLLQYGCPVETLQRALMRNGDGSGSGPLAHAIDLCAARG